MGMPFDTPPPAWDVWRDKGMREAGGDVYYWFTGEDETAASVWVYHWHTPTDLPARWQASSCGKHTLVQKEPLTLSPSLACEDGCTWHGYIENGYWRSV